MTGPQQLDLVLELQSELGWAPAFAASALEEYRKWLKLRAKAGDFYNVKLPPSRVVAMVWSLHRNWTADYERTCADVGGFLHHFPPAMRMNLAREQAYAATIHTYKSVFKRDPPSDFWGPAICPYKPLSDEQDLDHSAARQSSAAAPPKDKPASEPITRRSSYSTRRTSDEAMQVEKPLSSPGEDARLVRRPSKSSKEGKQSSSRIDDEIDSTEDANPRVSKPKSRRKLSSSLYVLKPLGPGEKRKRGRPSFSDYVLATDLSKAPPSAEQKKKDSKDSKPGASAPKERTTVTIRRRRSAISPKPSTAAPVIAKKEKVHNKSLRRVGRAAVAAGSAIADIASAVGSKTSAAAGGPSKSTAAPEPSPQSKEGAVPLKRPRGRPRKDGSWPVARGRPAIVAAKPSAPKPAAPKLAGPKQSAPKTSPPKPAPPKVNAPSAPKPIGEAVAPLTEKSEGEQPTQNGTGAKESPAGAGAPGKPSKQPQAMEGVQGADAAPAPGTTPSKIIAGGGAQVQDISSKAPPPKPLPLQAGNNTIPRESPFGQPIGGDSIGAKPAHSPLAPPKDVPSADPVFPQPGSLRNPTDTNVEMDMPLGSMVRHEVPSVSMGASLGVSAGLPPPQTIGQQNPGFPLAPMKAVPIAPAPVVSGVPTMAGMPMMQTVQASAGVPDMSSGNPMVDQGMMAMSGPGMQPKLDIGNEMDVGDMDDGDPKKPFRRPRARVRRDAQWPVARKPVSDEAVERVKDLNDSAPPLNFPMGPPGSV